MDKLIHDCKLRNRNCHYLSNQPIQTLALKGFRIWKRSFGGQLVIYIIKLMQERKFHDQSKFHR